MIYLLRSFGEKGKSILKIGFTEDNNLITRKKFYVYHNPLCQFLKEIPMGTKEDESRLHYKFRHLKYSKLDEWFIDSEEIIEFISTCSLKEINNLPLPESDREFRGIYSEMKYELDLLIREMLKKVSSNKKLVVDRVEHRDLMSKVKEAKCLSLRDAYEYLLTDSKFSSLSIFDFDALRVNTEDMALFLLKFKSLTQFQDKMRLVCEKALVMDPKSSEYFEFLKYLPNDYGGYLNTLGPEVILGYGCQKSKIEVAFQKSHTFTENLDPLTEAIFSKFTPRERYTKSQIKEILKKIYKSLGIKQTAKASDLENWFEVRRSVITVSKKKFEGFEIIKKK